MVTVELDVSLALDGVDVTLPEPDVDAGDVVDWPVVMVVPVVIPVEVPVVPEAPVEDVDACSVEWAEVEPQSEVQLSVVTPDELDDGDVSPSEDTPPPHAAKRVIGTATSAGTTRTRRG